MQNKKNKKEKKALQKMALIQISTFISLHKPHLSLLKNFFQFPIETWHQSQLIKDMLTML